ncbi:hypothetical protein [Alteromonas phage PB15]|nr:hypothetical protein [Alteromonas phage PB15]
MTYAVHTKLVETQDCKDMLSIYPTPAEYGDFYLFAQPHSNPQQPIVDMQEIEDLEAFGVAYNQLLAQGHTGRWIYLSEEQGRYLLGKYYPPEESEL